ncbi:fatty acid CoA ligase family protein [Elongatibacter sediminis]|uniref:Fatty acid CoA ligase family protein n=1 Tax=Elongatibacter sediminis TaxID=3119006 RepID=A0AAW9R602_9GAMM
MDTTVNDAAATRPWNTGSVCNVAGALAWQASQQPAAIAMHYPHRNTLGRVSGYRSCTYRELNDLANAYAGGLEALGITAGTRTALMLRPGLNFVAVFFALFKAGAVPVLIDPGIDRKSLKQCLGEAAPEAFIGVTRAQFARRFLGWARNSLEILVTDGWAPGTGGTPLKKLARTDTVVEPVQHPTQADDLAAILFTSGSTGAPKGVVYRHRHFVAQVEMLRDTFAIEEGEVSLQTFPPFALFDPALGMTTVIPDMDPTRPAEADPAALVELIEKHEVTTVFGSPALLDTLSRHTEQTGHRMWSIRRVISAGAAVPLRVIRRLEGSLANDTLIHTPYGATECLPVSNVTNQELDARVQDLTESGEGFLVGQPVTGNEVRVIRITDDAIDDIDDATPMPPGMPGEIIVRGPSCTDTYWARDTDTALGRIPDGSGGFWHRMGDVGILDGQGRLWYCGRVAQRIETGKETLFAEQCEGVFNQHPDAARTAVVGVGPRGRQIPVLCVEVTGKLEPVDRERVHYDLLQLAQAHPLTRSVRTVLFHPGFPVDIRHNAKIGREELARWAAGQMQT